MRNRPGAALLEALVAALLGTLVTGTAVLLLQAQARIARNTSERSERNDALRSALAVLRAELTPLHPAHDVRAVAAESVATRILRGVAIVCALDGEQTYARYRGLRFPDTAKDSVLEVGVEQPVPVLSARADSASCPAREGESVLSFRVPARTPLGSVWLFFESGSYHLSSHALRYRRPGESRQPITNEVLDHAHSAFRLHDASGLAVTLSGRGQRTSINDYLFLANQP
jgi:hypothetical protein